MTGSAPRPRRPAPGAAVGWPWPWRPRWWSVDQLTKWWAVTRLARGPDPRDRDARPRTVAEHRRVLQPVPGQGRRAGPGGRGPGGGAAGDGLAGPVGRPGRRPRAHRGRRAGQSLPTASSGTTTAPWSTSWPCTSGPPSTWPTPASWSGCILLVVSFLRGRHARRDDADGGRAGLARRGAGRQGGGPGGRPVAVGGRRAGGARAGSGSTGSWSAAGARPSGQGRAARGRPGRASTPGRLRWPTRRCAFEVVYDDAEVIVVDKPAGLVVHPGAGHRTGHAGQRAAGPLPRARRPWPEQVGSDPDRPGHRPPAGPGHLRAHGGGPHAGRLPRPGGPAGRPRGVPELPGPGARHGGRDVGRGGRPDRPLGRAHPPGWPCPARARRPAPATTSSSRFAQPVPTTLLTATPGDRPDPPDPGPPGCHRPPGGRRRRLRPGTVAARGRLSRPVPARLLLAFDHPGTGRAVSWTSELPDDLRRQLERLSG